LSSQWAGGGRRLRCSAIDPELRPGDNTMAASAKNATPRDTTRAKISAVFRIPVPRN
jgi:hypothetical protein